MFEKVWVMNSPIGQFNYNTHRFTWVIQMNSDNRRITSPMLRGLVPEGNEFDMLVMATRTTKDGNYETKTAAFNQVRYDDVYIRAETFANKSNEFKITFTPHDGEVFETEDTFTFIYDTFVQDIELQKVFEACADTGRRVREYINEVRFTANYGWEGMPQIMQTAKSANTLQCNLIRLNGSYNKEESKVKWEVLVNEERLNMEGLHIVDDIGAGQALVPDSLEIFAVSLYADGTVNGRTKLDAAALEKFKCIENEKDGKGLYLRIPEGVFADKSLLICYQTAFQDNCACPEVEKTIALRGEQVYITSAPCRVLC